MPVKAGKKQRWYPDKNGTLLQYGDLVWVEIYERRIKQKGVQTVLGRFLCEEDDPFLSSRQLKIEICDGLSVRKRKSTDLELAVDCEELYEDFIAECNAFLMLEKLEGCI